MILTPRSCPSSPGLATRMRSGRDDILLQPGGIAVLPEDVAVEVGDLAEGAHRTHRADKRRHEVLVRRRGLADPRQRLPRRHRVALMLHATDTLGLPRL